MAEFNELYQRALYYDIAFRRDVSKEVDFIEAVYEKYVGQVPTSLLDLACGPGYHARIFASRDKRAVGLDIRPEMLTFASDQADLDGVGVEWISADMRDMRLAEPVDVVINVFDGIDCLLTNDDLIAHFQAVANNLTEDGLYFIDLTHPSHVTLSHYPPFTYRGERDGIRVTVLWKGNPENIDPLTCIARTDIEFHVQEGGQTHVYEDVAEERCLTAQELVLLARCAGSLEPVAWFGDYDLNLPFDTSPAAKRMLAVFKKVSA